MKTETRTRNRFHSRITSILHHLDLKIEAWVMHLIEQIDYIQSH